MLDYLIAVPVATILGPSEIYLDAGSTINITCVIQHTPVPTPNVNWLHQDEVLVPDALNLQIENLPELSMLFCFCYLLALTCTF